MNTRIVRELISVVTGSRKYGGRGPPWVPYKPRNHAWGCPGGVVGRRDPGFLVRWPGSQVLFSRAGAPLLQGFATKVRPDNRVFHADLSLTY